MKRVVQRLRRSAGGFCSDRRGNVAIIFSLAALPLVGFIGASIDYSRASSVRTAFQNALDSTALMLAKEASSDSSTQLQANAAKYFNALFGDTGVSGLSVTASYSNEGGSKVVVSGSGNVPTTFMKVLGYRSIGIGGSSTAAWGSTRLRVALVLDNTGSMTESGKLTALKTATQNMLTQLQSAASMNGDVYVSIVPFVKDVNVGAGNYNSDWIYWGTAQQDPTGADNTSWEANNGNCSTFALPFLFPSPRAACLANSGTWTPKSHSTWNGCVMDRGFPTSPSNLSGNSGPDMTNNYDATVGSPDVTKPASLYAAEQYGSCPSAAVMGLNYDWPAMSTVVNNMRANGNTNQAVGLQLGWMSLVGGGPFTAPTVDPNYNYTQIIILLTDGLNTQNRWYTNQTSIDTRQQLTCNNIKASGITLYTIQVNTGGDPTSSLLQNCASSPGKFFLLTSASQIVTTFQAIGTNLTQLRVAR